MKQRFLPLIAVIGIGVLLLWLRFPDFFQYTNSRHIEPWGDGYKAYQAIFYHIDFDTTLSHFNGMNYPYGEHVVPGACQPFFANTLKVLQRIGWDVTAYKLGLLHTFMLTGIVLAALFLYLIFKRLQLPWWYAMLSALALAAMSPQVARMVSHYGLAHPEVLPITFYLLLRWHERPHWKWSLALAAVVWFYSLIHFYYFAVLSFAIVGWVGVRWLLQKDWRSTGHYAWHGFLMLGIPFLFFYAWMLYPDPVADRNPVPWGFFHFRARDFGLFTNLSQPHWQWIHTHISPIRTGNIEEHAYIGLIGMLFMLIFIGKWVRNRFRWPLQEEGINSQYLQYLLVSGILIGIFSMGIPFTLPFGEKLLKYTGPLQQFRSIGRFAWVLYYAINIAGIYYWYQWTQKSEKKWLLILISGILLLEAYHFNKAQPIDLDDIDDWRPEMRFTDLPIDYTKYQACLPIPYYNIGSDNFWWEMKGLTGQKSLSLSMQTGLPLTAAMLTRTSLSQTLNQLQLVTPPYRIPVLLQDLPDDRPFLMLFDKERVHEFGATFTHINAHAQLLFERDWMQLYELPLESFAQRLKDQVANVQRQADTMVQMNKEWLATDSLGQWYYDDFDRYPHPDAYWGTGMLQGEMPWWNRLIDTVWKSDYTGEVTVSFWQYLNEDRSARAQITWVESDASTGTELFRQTRITRENVVLFDDNGWGLVEFNLPRQQANSRIELIVFNPDRYEGKLFLDEVLVRPTGVSLARRRPEGIWWNNRWYPQRVWETPAK
ncbi:MAG: hypothetical protein R2795_12610 [Saprospiraceae bacterium]